MLRHILPSATLSSLQQNKMATVVEPIVSSSTNTRVPKSFVFVCEQCNPVIPEMRDSIKDNKGSSTPPPTFIHCRKTLNFPFHCCVASFLPKVEPFSVGLYPLKDFLLVFFGPFFFFKIFIFIYINLILTIQSAVKKGNKEIENVFRIT